MDHYHVKFESAAFVDREHVSPAGIECGYELGCWLAKQLERRGIKCAPVVVIDVWSRFYLSGNDAQYECLTAIHWPRLQPRRCDVIISLKTRSMWERLTHGRAKAMTKDDNIVNILEFILRHCPDVNNLDRVED